MNSFDLSKMIITKINSVVKVKADENIMVPRLNRPCWAIDVKVDGRTKFKQNENEFQLDSTHIMLLPKETSYEWISFGGECLIVDFGTNLESDSLLCFPVKDTTEIHNLMVKLYSEYLKNGSSLSAFSTLYRILHLIQDSQKKDYAFSSKEKIIEEGMKYLKTHYMDPELSTKTLSDICQISEIYFRKIFTEIYKKSPMQYLQSFRMKMAEELLQTDYSSISQIAEACGYQSLYHFSKMFKKYYGFAPSKLKTIEK